MRSVWEALRRAGAAAAVASLVACGLTDDEQPSAAEPGHAGGGTGGGYYFDLDLEYFPDSRPPPPDDLVWERCAAATNGSGTSAECAQVQVPRRWEEPSGPTLPLYVKRYRPTSQPRGQLWLLNGGPGDSGVGFEPLLPTFLDAVGDLEIYMPDHRGTGRAASRLGCPVQEDPSSEGGASLSEDEFVPCRDAAVAQWGGDLTAFTVTEAAQDIGELITRTRRAGDEVYLYGVSYGTYWLQRYLQLYPDQADGAVLDSICAPGECDFSLRYDALFDVNGRQLLEGCAADAACGARLGGDPWGFLGDLLDRVDNGHCADLGLDRASLRRLAGLMSMDWLLRRYLPAALHRIDRCSPGDVAAIESFGLLLQSMFVEGGFSSLMLTAHIGFSEFVVEPAPSVAQVEANVAALRVSRDMGTQLMPYFADWPRYDRDEYYGQFATTTVPLLMLNGTLDPQTPLVVAQPILDHFTGPNQTAVVVERSAHAVLVQSPVDRFGEQTCGVDLIGQFLNAPTSPVDATCRTQVLALDFDGDPLITPLIFGSDDAWENADGFTGQSVHASAGEGQAAIRRLRQRLRWLR